MKGTIQMHYLLLFLLLIQVKLSAQRIQNGSFERHDFTDCGINVKNDIFNSKVPNIIAFGDQSEIDILGPDCDYSQAEEGKYFAALYQNESSDAFSFVLDEPIKANKYYKLHFKASLGERIFNNLTQVEIGVSNEAEVYGETIFTSTTLGMTWRAFEIEFQLENSFQFLQVSITSQEETWVFLDDFYFECPEIDLGADTLLCEVNNFPLEVDPNLRAISWSDGSTGPNFVAQKPDIYWVQSEYGNCISTDTISIQEIPGNCLCSLYIPTAFSPNNDGINDLFQPLTDCQILDYHIRIFGKWGNLVFESKEFNIAWDGRVKGLPAPVSGYYFEFQYRYDYQTEIQIERGDFLLIR